MLAAADAARFEVDDMIKLCNHPIGTLLAIKREMTDDGINEQTRIVPPQSGENHATIWSIEAEENLTS